MTKYSTYIDFIVVSYYRTEYVKLLINSINRFVKNIDFNITVVANEDVNSIEYQELVKLYENTSNVTVITGLDTNTQSHTSWTTNMRGDRMSVGSINHSKALSIGVEKTAGEYVCFLDNDSVFLDTWVDDVLPLLEKYLFVTSRFEGNIARPMFMIYKRDTAPNPNTTYVDSCGNITKFANDNNLKFKVLENSLSNVELRKDHLLAVPHGEQTYIDAKPFHFHYGRGSHREVEKYDEWVDTVRAFLNEK